MSTPLARRRGRPPKPVTAPPVRAVRTACALLRTLSASHPALTLTELAAATGLHKSRCLRMAASLIAEGLLLRDADGRFRIGPFAHALGTLYRETDDLPRLVEPELAALAARSRESASLYLRDGAERVLLLRVPSPESVRDHLEVGARLPLTRGAAGKVLCAFGEPAGEISDKLKRDLARTRRLGFASSFGERDPQISAVAVPVWRVGGNLVGALALSGPRTRLTVRRIPGLRRLLVEAAARLSAALGHRPEDGGKVIHLAQKRVKKMPQGRT